MLLQDGIQAYIGLCICSTNILLWLKAKSPTTICQLARCCAGSTACPCHSAMLEPATCRAAALTGIGDVSPAYRNTSSAVITWSGSCPKLPLLLPQRLTAQWQLHFGA